MFYQQEKTLIQLFAIDLESFKDFLKKTIQEKYLWAENRVKLVKLFWKSELFEYEFNGNYFDELSVLDCSNMVENNTAKANFKGTNNLKNKNELYCIDILENIAMDTIRGFRPELKIKIKSGRSPIFQNMGSRMKRLRNYTRNPAVKTLNFFKDKKKQFDEYNDVRPSDFAPNGERKSVLRHFNLLHK
eukprot:Platyproteum_vivax@DN1606_c0_g1_i1.p1